MAKKAFIIAVCFPYSNTAPPSTCNPMDGVVTYDINYNPITLRQLFEIMSAIYSICERRRITNDINQIQPIKCRLISLDGAASTLLEIVNTNIIKPFYFNAFL